MSDPAVWIHELDPAPAPPDPTDLVEGERDPTGAPTSEKITWAQAADGNAFLLKYLAREKGSQLVTYDVVNGIWPQTTATPDEHVTWVQPVLDGDFPPAGGRPNREPADFIWILRAE